MKANEPRLLQQYVASQSLPEAGLCWDCEAPFGPRAVLSFRGVTKEGAFVTESICIKCAEKERRLIDAGADPVRRRKYLGYTLMVLATLCALFCIYSIFLVTSLPGYDKMWSVAAAFAAPPLLLLGMILALADTLIPRRLRNLLPKGKS